MQVISSAFQEGATIPEPFTCKGVDISPPLTISGVPDNAQALAVVLDDPDAPGGTWTHWTLWDLPVSAARLAENADIKTLGGLEGMTSARSVGYHGPCPPSATHRYFFRVFALDAKLALPTGAAIDAVHAAIKKHTIEQAVLMGKVSY